MSTKARLQKLAEELRPAAPQAPVGSARRESNPARGLRGDFHKVTITLPIEMLRDLRLLGLERRARGGRSTGISELVREAIGDFLEKAHHEQPPGTP